MWITIDSVDFLKLYEIPDIVVFPKPNKFQIIETTSRKSDLSNPDITCHSINPKLINSDYIYPQKSKGANPVNWFFGQQDFEWGFIDSEFRRVGEGAGLKFLWMAFLLKVATTLLAKAVLPLIEKLRSYGGGIR